MKTTVHVQRDPAEHYQVVLKHRSGQPKVVTSVTCKKGRVRSRGRVFFGRGMEGRGASIILEQADQEDLRMAIDFLTQLRMQVVGDPPLSAEERASVERGLADLKAGRVVGPFKNSKDLRAALKKAKPGDTVDMGPSYDAPSDPTATLVSMLEAAGAKVVDVTPKKRKPAKRAAKRKTKKSITPKKS